MPRNLSWLNLQYRFVSIDYSRTAFAADPEKVRAIADFVTPANLTDLRPFMGLVSQLAVLARHLSLCRASPSLDEPEEDLHLDL